GNGEGHPHRRRPEPAQALRGEHLRQLPLASVSCRTDLGVEDVERVAFGLFRGGLRAEHADQVALARAHGPRWKPFGVAVPGPEEITLDQPLELVPDLVRGRRLELLR